MGSAMSMCGQKVSPVTNVGCEKAPGHDGPHGVLFGASPVTSPRTPRQLLGWTVPDHIESGTIGRWVNVTCRHGACHGTPESSRTYYVPAMSVAAAPAPFATFLRNHAHGGEATHTLAPLSEVLPETPEPPREDEEHDDLADVPLEDHGTWTKRQAVTRRDEAERGAERCYFEGCPEWITGSSDYCPEHAKLYAPVPASQSVPAVPVSSTGGKETGEGNEDARGADEPDYVTVPVTPQYVATRGIANIIDEHFGDDYEEAAWAAAEEIVRQGYAYPRLRSPISREELGRRVSEVALKWSREQDDRPGATATWEQLADEFQELHMRVGEAMFGLGMTLSPVPSPLPDSETEWGIRPVGQGEVEETGAEEWARAVSARMPTLYVAVSRRAAGPWIEVTS